MAGITVTQISFGAGATAADFTVCYLLYSSILLLISPIRMSCLGWGSRPPGPGTLTGLRTTAAAEAASPARRLTMPSQGPRTRIQGPALRAEVMERCRYKSKDNQGSTGIYAML